MEIFELATQTSYSIDLRRKAGEEAHTCPKCSESRKKKNLKCFSWNHDTKLGRCNHCEAGFAIKKVKDEFAKVYDKPKFNNRTELSKGLVDWFFARGISQQTLLDLKITEGDEWMPQIEKNTNTVQFNYFRHGELVNVKYRDARKNFKLAKNAELIFYNLDAIAASQECVICEGEIDAMSWIEAGYPFAISVPNGASKNAKLEYLDNCSEYFDNKTKIYLATDNDEAGKSLQEELARRLGYERCFKLDYGTLKDSNEYLVVQGKESLTSLLNASKEYPIKGVFTIDDIWGDIEDIYENGLPSGAKTGDNEMDKHIGFMPGELTMVTGIPGQGKSILLDQISLGLCINSDWRFAVCSPESHPMAFYYTRLIKRATGKKFSKANISPTELQEYREWIKDRYCMIKPDDGYNLDEILLTAKQLVLRMGINGLIIDPWNRIENSMPAGFNEGKWIIECLNKIIKFAQTAQVHVFLVAHPTKMPKTADGSNYIVPNLYSISGSAHFFNMTQNGMTIFRNYVTGKTELHIQKVKWEHLGKTGMIEYDYNVDNARFVGEGQDPYRNWISKHQPIIPESTHSAIQPNLAFESLIDSEIPF